AARLRERGEQQPGGGAVASVDRMGRVGLRPPPGGGWPHRRRRGRRRADYNRRAGTRYVFGAYDVHADRLRVRLRPRRAGSDVLSLIPQIRLAYPSRQPIYWIQDNLSANWTQDNRPFAPANNNELNAA